MTLKQIAGFVSESIRLVFGPGAKPYPGEAPAKFRRGFLEFRVDQNVKGLRAFYVDERPGWGGADVRKMNARNGVGSSKIRKARSK